MPIIAVLDLLVAVFLMNHVRETGRPQYWYFIILAIPFVGSIAYVLFEVIPDMGNTRRGQKAAKGIADILAPDREFHRLHDDAATRDSIDAKEALAEECERKGMWKDAIRLYQAAAQGIYSDDQKLLVGLARAHVGNGTVQSALDTLERLRQAHPDIKNQDAHLLYARCLKDLGRSEEAVDEFEALSGYYVGLEARTRYALILMKKGEPAKAKALFESVVKAGSSRGIVLSDADRNWLKVAKSNV